MESLDRTGTPTHSRVRRIIGLVIGATLIAIVVETTFTLWPASSGQGPPPPPPILPVSFLATVNGAQAFSEPLPEVPVGQIVTFDVTMEAARYLPRGTNVSVKIGVTDNNTCSVYTWLLRRRYAVSAGSTSTFPLKWKAQFIRGHQPMNLVAFVASDAIQSLAPFKVLARSRSGVGNHRATNAC